MRTFSLVFFLAIFTSPLAAQQFTSSITDEYESNRNFPVSVKIGDKYWSMITDWSLRIVDVDVSIAETDETGKVTFRKSKKELELKDAINPTIVKIGGKVYVIYQQRLKGNYISNVMASEIDSLSLELGEPKAITQIEKVGYAAKLPKDNTQGYSFFYRASADSNYISIVLSNEKNASQLYVAMLDNQLNSVWQKTETLNAIDEDTRVTDVCADNNGNTYISYKLYTDVINKLPAKNQNCILVMNNGKKVKSLSLDPGTAFLKSIVFLPSEKNNSIHFAGYYYQSDFRNLQGLFSGQINMADISIKYSRKDPFSSQLLEQLEKDRWASSKGAFPGVSSSLELQMMEMDNGCLDVIGEFRTVNRSAAYYAVISGSIVNCYIGIEKTIFSWVPKYRVSAGSTIGDSFSAFPYDDKIIVFYNDKEEHLKKDIADPAGNSNVYKNVVLIAAVILPDGSVTRKIVIDQQRENFVAITDDAERITKTRFEIPFYKVKAMGGSADGVKLGTIKFNK